MQPPLLVKGICIGDTGLVFTWYLIDSVFTAEVLTTGIYTIVQTSGIHFFRLS